MPRSKHNHANTVVGVFYTRDEAEHAVRDLKAAGFDDSKIGMISRNAEGKLVQEKGETYAEEGAVTGAAVGAGVGGLVGLGVLSGVIPVVGPVLALGTLGTILLNAAGGAALAGLAGALVGWGIPEEDASYYEEQVKGGRFLVTVEAADRRDEAWTVLHRFGGYNKTHPTPVRGSLGHTIQLREEELRVSKTPVKTGEVEVRKEVVTEHKRIDVPVEREEVVIERRPARGAAAGDVKAEQIRIPVSEEKVHVTKQTVAKEEVTVGKRKVTDHRTVSGTVRKEELKVNEEGDARVTRRSTTK
ncbi:MAG: YsnF/AvaK domain-containing protein [Gemmataceae bacterium]|nr:YsnF/AvaK domain-containing protein [Gemmataceae bacterium]